MNPPPLGLALVLLGCAAAATAALLPDDPEAAEPVNRILACDPSGSSPREVCAQELVESEGLGWAKQIEVGGTFRVILSAGAFGDVGTVLSLRVPSSWGGDPRLGILRWQQGMQAQLQSLAIAPAADPRINQSELIGLLNVTAQTAHEISGPTDVLLASDGRFISLGFNAEKQVPSAAQVEARMSAQGIAIDLTGLHSFTMCGLHNHQTDPAKDAALRLFWATLIPDLGGPSPKLLSSCRALITDEAPPPSTSVSP